MTTRSIRNYVVVVANENNPTILHPSFLTNEGIIRDELSEKINDDHVISTRALSRVSFNNGIEIQVTSDRVQVSDTRPQEKRAKRDSIYEITKKYIRTLRHVRYTAIGVNFSDIFPISDPGIAIRDRFLTSGRWNCSEFHPDACDIKFSYSSHGGTLNITLADGTVQFGGENTETIGIISDANYHFELSSANAVNAACTKIDGAGDLRTDLDAILEMMYEGIDR